MINETSSHKYSSIFNFEYVNEVWISGVLGVKPKNCSGSRTAIWVCNCKNRCIFILFFARMNYLSGSVLFFSTIFVKFLVSSVIMVLINQIISVITAVFLVFFLFVVTYWFFPPLSYPNYSFKLLKRYDVLSCFLLCAHFHGNYMRFSLYFLIQWFPAEGLKIGGAQNNRRFLLLFLPKSGGALAPFLQHTRLRRLYWIV